MSPCLLASCRLSAAADTRSPGTTMRCADCALVSGILLSALQLLFWLLLVASVVCMSGPVFTEVCMAIGLWCKAEAIYTSLRVRTMVGNHVSLFFCCLCMKNVIGAKMLVCMTVTEGNTVNIVCWGVPWQRHGCAGDRCGVKRSEQRQNQWNVCQA